MVILHLPDIIRRSVWEQGELVCHVLGYQPGVVVPEVVAAHYPVCVLAGIDTWDVRQFDAAFQSRILHGVCLLGMRVGMSYIWFKYAGSNVLVLRLQQYKRTVPFIANSSIS